MSAEEILALFQLVCEIKALPPQLQALLVREERGDFPRRRSQSAQHVLELGGPAFPAISTCSPLRASRPRLLGRLEKINTNRIPFSTNCANLTNFGETRSIRKLLIWDFVWLHSPCLAIYARGQKKRSLLPMPLKGPLLLRLCKDHVHLVNR